MARLWRDFPEGLEAAAEIADACRFRMEEIRGRAPAAARGRRARRPRGRRRGGAVEPGAGRAVAPRSRRCRARGLRTTCIPTAASASTSTETPTSRPIDPDRATGVSPDLDLDRDLDPDLDPRARADGVTGMALLRELVRDGARWRYGGEPPEDVARQLARELDLVEQLGYASYFLTVWDVVRFARSRGILCQGRGSAANSAVCFVLGITSIDPVRMGLLFERFLSAERGEPPDIDVDFEHERREEVIQYVYGRYGRDRAGMVCEVISYRGQVRAPRRGQGARARRSTRWTGSRSSSGCTRTVSAGRGRELARAGRARPGRAPSACGMTLAPRRASCRASRATSPSTWAASSSRAGRSARPCRSSPPRCRGAPSSSGTRTTSPSSTSSRWTCSALGMLTALSRSLALLARHRPAPSGRAADPSPTRTRSPPSRRRTRRSTRCSRGPTPSASSRSSRARRCRSRRGSSRGASTTSSSRWPSSAPGPSRAGMVHPYLRRRDGQEEVRYPYPPLEPVLAKTLGVPLFQEQVMRLAVVAAGFTPGEADELRRRHDPQALARADRGDARRGSSPAWRSAGIPAADAELIFQQLHGFAGYGFPESHSASFALLVYASAWLKRYHPAAFACALLNSQPMGFYAPHTLVEDAKRHGVEVRGRRRRARATGRARSRGRRPGAAAAAGRGARRCGSGSHAVRGLPRAVGEAILAARRGGAVRLGRRPRRGARASRAPGSCGSPRRARSASLAPDRRERGLDGASRVEADEGDLFAGVTPPEPEAPLAAGERGRGGARPTSPPPASRARAHPMAVVRPGARERPRPDRPRARAAAGPRAGRGRRGSSSCGSARRPRRGSSSCPWRTRPASRTWW